MLEESLVAVIQNTNNLAHPLWSRYLQKYKLTLNFVKSNKDKFDYEAFALFLDKNIISHLMSIFKEAVVNLTIETKNILFDLTLSDCNIVDETYN